MASKPGIIGLGGVMLLLSWLTLVSSDSQLLNFTQRVDHTAPTNTSDLTFTQRLLVDDTRWEGAKKWAPIFVLFGGENGQTFSPEQYEVLNQSANEFGAMLVHIEGWSIKDDEALVSGYINAGGDVGESTYQTKVNLWDNIEALYNKSREENPDWKISKRTKKALQVRWNHINELVGKWVGCYSLIRRNPPQSGESEEDIEMHAHESFHKQYGKHFVLTHCWQIMRKKKKWGAGTMLLPSDSRGSKRSESEYLIGDSEENRPYGVKKMKNKGKEKATSSFVNIDSLTSTLDESNLKRHEQGERMYSLIKERSEDRKRQKEEEAKIRIFSILATNPNRDSDDEELYRKLKNEFRGRFI